MEFWDLLLQSFQEIATPTGLIYVVIGTLAGVVLGAIPGLGSSTLMVVLLPISYKMDINLAMALFISITIGGMSGGCIGSILLGIPGTSSSLCTVWDGYEFTKELRDGGSELPILMVTARETPSDVKRGFIIGTDDYMTKPVDEEEMLLRIAALLRRSRIVSEKKLTVGGTVLEKVTVTAAHRISKAEV